MHIPALHFTGQQCHIHIEYNAIVIMQNYFNIYTYYYIYAYSLYVSLYAIALLCACI